MHTFFFPTQIMAASSHVASRNLPAISATPSFRRMASFRKRSTHVTPAVQCSTSGVRMILDNVKATAGKSRSRTQRLTLRTPRGLHHKEVHSTSLSPSRTSRPLTHPTHSALSCRSCPRYGTSDSLSCPLLPSSHQGPSHSSHSFSTARQLAERRRPIPNNMN